MKSLYVFALLALVGCAEKITVTMIPGTNGADGQDGYSVVSWVMSATDLECANLGGARTDFYQDLDRSGDSSDGDRYLNSAVVCNGSNGNNGHDGIAGPPGSAGPPGLNGNPGHDGVDGPTGPPGSNGSNGTNGSNGHGGGVVPKNITGLCTSLSANYDAKIKNNTVEIYTAGQSCAAPAKVFTLATAASTFWISDTELAVFVEPAGVRILAFN